MHHSVVKGKNFRIAEKVWLSDTIFSMWVEAPDIAASFKAGQFVIVRLDDKGERIPLTIAAVDGERKHIRLVVQVVGYTTQQLGKTEASDCLLDVVGPLGQPIHIKKFPGPVIGVGGGLGAAPLLPQLQAYRDAGNHVIAILGARNEKQMLLIEETQAVAHELYLATDDGSVARKGFVSDVLTDLLETGIQPSLIIAIGPPIMMKVTCGVAVKRGFPVMASLNPIMVDGTGMCGGCRVTVGDQTYFACVDGPDFDGSKVDWDEVMARLGTYRIQEKVAYDHNCLIGLGGR